MKKRFLFLPFFAVVLSTLPSPRLYAANVSVLVVETGILDGIPLEIQRTREWESGLMNVFFEKGHVVSNADTFALASKPAGRFPDGFGYVLELAEEGGVDFLVLAFLEYEPGGKTGKLMTKNEPAKPTGADIRLFTVRKGELLHSELLSSGAAFFGKDEGVVAESAARKMIPYMRAR
jgi:hypothetical protein